MYSVILDFRWNIYSIAKPVKNMRLCICSVDGQVPNKDVLYETKMAVLRLVRSLKQKETACWS